VPSRYDVAIVGGGILGLATAFQLMRRRPGLSLAIIEKERRLATHQSGRNSGVVHSGLYYRPGSLKARLCREGKAELEEFAAEHGVSHRRCGKLVVAVRSEELTRLADLAERARGNGAAVEEVGPERIAELEPQASGIRAVYSPATGIIDFGAVAETLAGEIRAQGGQILTGREVRGIDERAGWWLLRTSPEPLGARHVISCAGLHADRVAAMTGARPPARIIPFRGGYLRLRPSARDAVRALIYPVPDPALPFLGVHLTRRLNGEVWVGPNAIPALSREGYTLGKVSWRDVGDMIGFGPFWRVAARHLGPGLREALHELFPRTLLTELRRYVPAIRADDLEPGPAGVRAQLVDRGGNLVDDFVVAEARGIIHVLNAPSPAATASLAIGRMIADRAEASFGLG
jgi:(S)-2-hydroxyglutarate dehydrogenase